jgi:hypothetical protein
LNYFDLKESSIMTTKHSTERGQALIIIALAAIGLFGITGLAIDGSAKFSDRRQAQHAADAAALAGSLANIKGDPEWRLSALDRALENGYDDNHVSNEVEVYTCDEVDASCGSYDDDARYVQVIITSHVNTYFARAVGVGQTHNTVSALAMSQEAYLGELYGGASIVGLAPDQCKTVWFSGSGETEITGGGVFSNSEVDCGLTIQGSTDLSLDGSIDMVASAYTKNGNPPLGGIAGGIHGSADPYDYPPPAGMLPSYTCDWTYSSFPPSGVSVLSPGTYCVTGSFKMNAGETLSGSSVTIVMQSGNIHWNGGAEINLSAPTSGDLAGMLIYAPMSNSQTMRFNGNGSTSLTGTIFMPAAPIVYNGTGNVNPSHVQVIGYTIELTGSNVTNVVYQDNDNWDSNMPARIGLVQ